MEASEFTLHPGKQVAIGSRLNCARTAMASQWAKLWLLLPSCWGLGLGRVAFADRRELRAAVVAWGQKTEAWYVC